MRNAAHSAALSSLPRGSYRKAVLCRRKLHPHGTTEPRRSWRLSPPVYIWLPLLATWYVLLLCALICFVVIPVSLAACLPVCLFVTARMIHHDLLRTLLAAGMGLSCIGAAALLTPPPWTACRGVVKFTGFTTKKLWCAVVS